METFLIQSIKHEKSSFQTTLIYKVKLQDNLMCRITLARSWQVIVTDDERKQQTAKEKQVAIENQVLKYF